jgi:DNA-binding cell septation regulator SpoVG
MANQSKQDYTTSVTILKPREGEKNSLLAYVNLAVKTEHFGTIQLNGFRVMKNAENQPFVSPAGKPKVKDGKPVLNEKTGKQEYSDFYHAITTEGRQLLHSAILTAFSAEVANQQAKAALESQTPKA